MLSDPSQATSAFSLPTGTARDPSEKKWAYEKAWKTSWSRQKRLWKCEDAREVQDDFINWWPKSIDDQLLWS